MITSSASARESSACSRSFIEANSRISSVPIFAKACMYACPVNFCAVYVFPDIKIFSGTRSLTNLLYTDIIHPPMFNSSRALPYKITTLFSHKHLTYQFLIRVPLLPERNNALVLLSYRHIRFGTHQESPLFSHPVLSPLHLRKQQLDALQRIVQFVPQEMVYYAKHNM
ncbi:conserved hypothetical protein [Bacillus cereus Q1]|uniref:Uncharacterized protein n=1 Tax=Bacillus cereus (strain Q1) TaxID=361100 RepID=B9IS50_BACCQ|nr:conserved hypothetical protein [Bacillus cereus Q1]